MAFYFLDREMQAVRESLLAMGGYVEKSIEEALACLFDRNSERITRVLDLEVTINQCHKDMDRSCLSILACQKPSAEDLRVLFAVFKINNELERMGDLAVNIAYNARAYLSEAQIRPLSDLPRMAGEVKLMVKDALDAFMHQNVGLAQNVLILDDLVDNLKRQIHEELVKIMKRDSRLIEPALDLILITRSLERLGDHATNIAEDVIFIATGEDVRHSGGLYLDLSASSIAGVRNS